MLSERNSWPKVSFSAVFNLTLYTLSDYLKDHDENGFINADLKNPINIFSPSLMDRERSVETQQAHAEDLNIPIKRLVERAASGLNDRASIITRKTRKVFIKYKMISEYDCGFGVIEVASGLRHGPMNYSIDWDWALMIPNTVSEVISTLNIRRDREA